MSNKAMIKVKKKWKALKWYKDIQEDQDCERHVWARKQVKWAMRQAKREYEMNITKEVKRNPKVFYK